MTKPLTPHQLATLRKVADANGMEERQMSMGSAQRRPDIARTATVRQLLHAGYVESLRHQECLRHRVVYRYRCWVTAQGWVALNEAAADAAEKEENDAA